MSTYENITVDEPVEVAPGQWTCKVHWSGDGCRGSESISNHRSTHFEAKKDAEVIAARLRNQNKTAVSKGDMPKLPAPVLAEEPHGPSVTGLVELSADNESKTPYGPGTHLVAESARKEELEAVAKALGCKRGDILEKIANLKERLAKESKEANHLAALAGKRGDKIDELASVVYNVAVTLETDGDGLLGAVQAMAEESRLCLETLNKAGISAATPSQGARMAAEKIREQDGTPRAIGELTRHYIRSMGIEPTGDIKSDLSECLAKYASAEERLSKFRRGAEASRAKARVIAIEIKRRDAMIESWKENFSALAEDMKETMILVAETAALRDAAMIDSD